MMGRGAAAAAVFLGLGMGHASLADDWMVAKDQWYFSPMIGMNFEDTRRDSDPGIAGSLGFGTRFAESWAAELSVFGSNNDGYNKFRPVGVAVDLHLKLGDPRLVSPYLLLGTGFLRGDVVEGPGINRELNYDNAIGTVGFGLVAPLGNAAARLRTEVRYRVGFDSPNFEDLIAMVGFYVPIGGQAAAAPAMAPPDGDRDGVTDDDDVCPGTPAGTEVDVFGCELDSDGDGVANLKDDCPSTPPATPVNSRGCSDATDTDQDGVIDRDDRCPGTPRVARVDASGCEVGDDDSDGVVDSIDSCPDTSAGARVDIRGCEITTAIKLPGVRFELNSATLISTSTARLDQAAATLRANPGLKVEAAGYTDTSGSPSLNLDLSQRRAESVRRYLISKGANPDNITSRGYGEANPIADNSIRLGRQQNRRVELRILN